MDLIYETVKHDSQNVIVFCSSKRQCESLAKGYTEAMVSQKLAPDTSCKGFDETSLDDATQYVGRWLNLCSRFFRAKKVEFLKKWKFLNFKIDESSQKWNR